MSSPIDPRGKLFAHLPRLAALQEGRTPAPINVEIDLSNRCSLGCEWCHFAYTHTRGPLTGKRAKPAGAIAGGDLMDLELAKQIVDQLGHAGVDSITWTGGGEPTLHPAFNEIVEFAAQGRGLEQGIYTHGGHIDDARAALLKQTMRFVYVSLDAATPEAYKAAKGVDRFDAACQGIRRLADAAGDATIGVGYLVTRDNWHASGPAAELARELGADYLQFRPTIAYDQATPDELAEATDWMDEALLTLDRLTRIVGLNVIADLDRFREYRWWDGHGYPTCWWSGLQTVITPNGKVWTCVNKREHPAAELGDLTREAFADIWARRPLARVDADCRIMCRGHVANTALDEIMAPRSHAAFV